MTTTRLFVAVYILSCQSIQTLRFDSVTVKVGVVMRWRLLILEVALPGWDFVEYLESRLRGDGLKIFVSVARFRSGQASERSPRYR